MGDHRTFFEALQYLAEKGDLGTLAYVLGDAELIRLDALAGERPSSPPKAQDGRSFFSADSDNGGKHIIG